MSIALAAPHAEAVAAGERAVARGGNALDAALAAAIMLTVVYPHQCAIGGDLIALVRAPSGETTAVIGAGTAPAAIEKVSSAWSSMPRQGAHSVTVPGMLGGWSAIAGLGARHGLDAALRDAAGIARGGVVVSAGLARAIDSRADAILDDPGLRGVFAPQGVVFGEGDSYMQPALADTLDRLAVDPTAFYEGDVARAMAAALREAGGVHADEDFAGFRAELLPALTTRAGGRSWSVAPPPSAAALIPAVVAAGIDGDGRADDELLVAAAVRGVAARSAHLGDPRSSAVDLEALLDLTGTARESAIRESAASGDTASVVATDDDGWSVTIVQSVYFTFGAGLLDPATGVLFHNRGGAFSLEKGSPALLGPGARPPHTLCPLIVEDEENLVIAGCQGGRAQPWILSQLFADHAALAAPLAETLARPRWIVGDVDLGYDRLTLAAEPGVPAAVLHAAETQSIPSADLPALADVAGHVQLARRTPSGLEAASDPRADGRGIVIPV
ncbi:gamma-glutamyltransferase [Microbacterium sp. ZW T5_45]|uniref:gamma-glutamyltransferase n=1 Tax=Microbacterium sp. ZW T5_45 TaxID=3378080 RepID=UPI0038537694